MNCETMAKMRAYRAREVRQAWSRKGAAELDVNYVEKYLPRIMFEIQFYYKLELHLIV